MIIFQEHLGQGDLFICRGCGTHLSRTELLESKQFKGKTGPAYLIKSVWNYQPGPAEDRHLLTGEHTIMEIYCNGCSVNVGWTYLHAYEPSQQYKVGKFILEKALLRRVKVLLPNPRARALKLNRKEGKRLRKEARAAQAQHLQVQQATMSGNGDAVMSESGEQRESIGGTNDANMSIDSSSDEGQDGNLNEEDNESNAEENLDDESEGSQEELTSSIDVHDSDDGVALGDSASDSSG